MTQIRYRVTGKDRLSDRWTAQDFDTRAEADDWAAQRAFLLPDLSGRDVTEMQVSDR